jgi:hypothetical protein
MRTPVKAWLSREGAIPVDEMPVCGKIPDVVGMKSGRIHIAVEMKLSNWRRALYQATLYTLFADRCYVAMPSTKEMLLTRNFENFRKWGVGVLIVKSDDEVYELNPVSAHAGDSEGNSSKTGVVI